jgi:hypothetical protein
MPFLVSPAAPVRLESATAGDQASPRQLTHFIHRNYTLHTSQYCALCYGYFVFGWGHCGTPSTFTSDGF